ncbi:MAG: SHOCT-like domain-containing protein [Chloroflexota bacterium]
MVTSEERMRILRMIQEGKISADEGAKLLAALRDSRKETRENVVVNRVGGSKSWLRIRVTDMKTNRNKVSVNLPMGLVEAGMKIGAQYAPELNGIDLNMIIEEVRNGAQGKIIDVTDEEDGERVEIFIE